MNNRSYIIITPAKNESEFIGKTIDSVVNQTVKPLVWVIVDDGSTDNTTEIVKPYEEKYSFIKLVNRASEEKRNFGNKVFAVRRGFEEVQHINYTYYCNLDADVSFESNYFEVLLKKFEENPRLGICGGKVYDLVNDSFHFQGYELHSVAGPTQFFRKECYESFSGYQSFESGFIDGHAEISARMNGWITQTFPELKVKHYRPAGIAKGSKLKMKFEGGRFEYRFGYSYSYHLIRSVGTFKNRPFLIGGLASMIGFLSCLLKAEEKVVDIDFIRFVRNEQSRRLKKKLKSVFKI